MSMLEQYLSQENIHSFEGSAGVRRLKQLIGVLGYSTLSEFLEDNPGAIEGIIEFIDKWVPRNAEWQARLGEVIVTPPAPPEGPPARQVTDGWVNIFKI